jgi:aspartate carbamoyltransferase catalytic subunit
VGFNLQDIISINDFSREDLDFVLNEAARMEALSRHDKQQLLHGKTVASLFFEPSTRTRLSFETATQNVGGNSIGFADPNTSSTGGKGESLTDTIRTVDGYADIIVIRHPYNGAARRAAEVTTKPIINAGDGSNQHPTQTLLDLYTIKKQFGHIEGLKIGILGDLKYSRTIHSLVIALSMYSNINLFLVNPDELPMPNEVLNRISPTLSIKQANTVDAFLPELDILYCNRIQKERFAEPIEYEKVKNAFSLGREILQKTKPGFKLLNPLPRINEIKQELDDTDAAHYFQQSANGIPTREALLNILQDVKK